MSVQTPSPLLDHCPPTLPQAAYIDQGWYDRELATIWRRNWVYAGRRDAFAPGSMTRRQVGGVEVIVVADSAGALSAFHNTCRHRGAALCTAESERIGKLIRRPYHAWAYAPDGRLVSTGYGTPTRDFDKGAHRLYPVSLFEWNGLLFLNLDETPEPLSPDMGLAALDNWPMDRLVTGHVFEKELACNWKIFWENYNECLHCPGIHPELCDMVPVYREGVMSEAERVPREGQAAHAPMKQGARSWTMSGAPCGPDFPGLTAEERALGFFFVTCYPSAFIVAHVDYVRVVSLQPLGPQRTRLRAEWLFAPETMAAPGFDLANVVDFATLVMQQDGDACELNQRGLASPAYTAGRLMPQEFDIYRFHQWVLAQMGEEV